MSQSHNVPPVASTPSTEASLPSGYASVSGASNTVSTTRHNPLTDATKPGSMFLSLANGFQQEMHKILNIEIEKFKKEFEPKMKDSVAECQRDLDTLVNKYYEKRKEFAKKMDDNLSNQANNKMIELRQKLDLEIREIEKELFNDPKSLLKQITEERKKLEYQRRKMKEERNNWGENEKKIARYLGFGNEAVDHKNDDVKMNDTGGLDDGMFYQNTNNRNNTDSVLNADIKGTDWITINVDGRIFGTYRSTLTQVPGSVLALMFGIRSEMMHRDDKGVYYLDRNSDTFAQVLEILRRRGAMPNNFELSPELQAELMELGLLNAYFKEEALDQEILLGGNSGSNLKLCFQTYRSESNQGHYVEWNKSGLQSSTKVSAYFELNNKDETELVIKKDGWYRLVARIVIRTNINCYAAIVINGSQKYYCQHHGYSTQYCKSFNFNEILKLTKGDKVKIYSSIFSYTEEKASYLCLETIPSDILSQVAVYNSTTVSSNYRVWDNIVKSSDNYAIINSYQIAIQKSGLYRISARVHTFKSNTSYKNLSCIMSICRNGGNNNRSIYNSQSCSSASACYLCHHFEEISDLQPLDYIAVTDNGYGSSNQVAYESINIQPIVSSGLVGSWHSNDHSLCIRIWTDTDMFNPMLFETVDDKQKILVKHAGYYRIGCMVTNTNSNDGYAAIYVNGNEYCLSKMGVHSGKYSHTISIQEILRIKKGDRIHVYCSHPHDNRQYNTLFIEKLMT